MEKDNAADAPGLKRPAGLPATAVENTICDECPRKIALVGESPLDSPVLVPVVLLFAAYVVYLFPERGMSVMLVLGALGTFGPTSVPLHSLLVDMLEKFSLRAANSDQLCTLAKQQMRAALNDPDVKRAFTNSCRDSMVEAMQDESLQGAMVLCCSQSVTLATIAASQDVDFVTSLNTAMKDGVKEALTDSTVVGTFFDVVKEGLRDPKMHSAAVKGAISAANPLKDLQVPTLSHLRGAGAEHFSAANPLKDLQNPLKAVSSTLKDVIVDAEAKTLANASGLSRAPPPTLQGSKSGSPQTGPERKTSDEFREASAGLNRQASHSPDPLEALIAPSRSANVGRAFDP